MGVEKLKELIVIIVILSVIVFLLYSIFHKKDKKVSVLYGYPAYKKTWLTVYHYRGSDKWIFEWDDLFDSGRPKSWGDLSECLMFKNKRSGATEEEFNKAWNMLKDRGLT